MEPAKLIIIIIIIIIIKIIIIITLADSRPIIHHKAFSVTQARKDLDMLIDERELSATTKMWRSATISTVAHFSNVR